MEDSYYNFSKYPYANEMRRLNYLPPHFIRVEYKVKPDHRSKSIFLSDQIAQIVLEECRGRYFYDTNFDAGEIYVSGVKKMVLAFEDERDAVLFTLHYQYQGIGDEEIL